MENNQNIEEQNRFESFDYEAKEEEIEQHQAQIRKARNSLFVVAVLVFLAEFIYAVKDGQNAEPSTFIVALIISGVFIALGIYTKYKPYVATVLGITCFLGYILLVAVINYFVDGAGGFFMGLFSGIFVKIIILAILIRTLPQAKKVEEARKAMKQ